MKWYHIFVKSVREQIRDYWILVLTLALAPFFVLIYYLMEASEQPSYEVVFVNLDRGITHEGSTLNLGDTLVRHLRSYAESEADFLHFRLIRDRSSGIKLLRSGDANVLIVLPEGLTSGVFEMHAGQSLSIELVGDITDMDYIVGAVWTEELVNSMVLEAAGITPPVRWTETPLGHSGQRTTFELYVPGLMILAIIMMIFTASAAIVREPEAGTLERLKISNLGALEFLSGISIIQVIVALISLLLTLFVAVALGYEVIPGTFGFILGIGFITALSMISFSLIVAGICRSIKDVAIIGTFPLFLLMFFSGAAFPIGGGALFSLGSYTLHMNDLLSPSWAVSALNKVLVRGQAVSDTLPEVAGILVLTVLYFILGVWAFRRKHMRAA